MPKMSLQGPRSLPPARRSLLPVVSAVAALLCAGCASSDLSKDSEITNEVVECLPADTPGPSVVARAIWYPNSRGFGSTDASPLGHATGVLALANDKLWFLEWNDPLHHLDVLHVIPVASSNKISVERFGNSAMLVIESGNESFDSFELMNKGQLGSDSTATEALCEKLQALRARDLPSGP